MRVIIDRFEEDIAVVELNGEMLSAPAALFKGAVEGDAVEITVLGRAYEQEGAENPHTIFERLRKRNKRNRRDCQTK